MGCTYFSRLAGRPRPEARYAGQCAARPRLCSHGLTKAGSGLRLLESGSASQHRSPPQRTPGNAPYFRRGCLQGHDSRALYPASPQVPPNLKPIARPLVPGRNQRFARELIHAQYISASGPIRPRTPTVQFVIRLDVDLFRVTYVSRRGLLHGV